MSDIFELFDNVWIEETCLVESDEKSNWMKTLLLIATYIQPAR